MIQKVQMPFSLEKWRKGNVKVETRDGRSVRILCADLKSDSDRSIVAALTDDEGDEQVEFYYQNGQLFDDFQHAADLVIIEEVEEPDRWADDKKAIGDGWFIDMNSDISQGTFYLNEDTVRNVFATRKQAKSARAAARISQLMAHDKRYGGVITDEEWRDPSTYKFAFMRSCDNIHVNYYNTNYCFLAFHTEEQRTLFLKENERLVKDYLMID